MAELFGKEMYEDKPQGKPVRSLDERLHDPLGEAEDTLVRFAGPPEYEREKRVPRYEEGGASAPPPRGEWMVDPPGGADRMYFATEAQAHDYAAKCPPHTRIVSPSGKWDFADTPLPPTAPLTATDFCATAARLVGGSRAATHGDKLINFANIAELWNGYWRIKCRVSGERLSTPFTPHDVGCMMELMKIGRRFSGSYNADDYIDAAGYAGCTGEIAAREVAKEKGGTP